MGGLVGLQNLPQEVLVLIVQFSGTRYIPDPRRRWVPGRFGGVTIGGPRDIGVPLCGLEGEFFSQNDFFREIEGGVVQWCVLSLTKNLTFLWCVRRCTVVGCPDLVGCRCGGCRWSRAMRCLLVLNARVHGSPKQIEKNKKEKKNINVLGPITLADHDHLAAKGKSKGKGKR